MHVGAGEFHHESRAPLQQAQKELDYAQLNLAVAQTSNTNAKEVGRIVYLSTPPKAYENASRAVAEHAHPANSPSGDPPDDMVDDDELEAEGDNEQTDAPVKKPWLE